MADHSQDPHPEKDAPAYTRKGESVNERFSEPMN